MENGKENNREKLLQILYSALIGIVVGMVFSLIFFKISLNSIIEGMLMGFLIFALSSAFEIYLFRPRYRKLKFSYILLFRLIFYVAAVSFSVLLVWVLNEARLENTGFMQVITSGQVKDFILRDEFLRILIFAIVVSILVIYISQMNYLLGQNVLMRYMSGKYYKPIEEERFFMFLDLTSSTTLAERTRPLEYHKFLNNYFFDVNDPIVSTRGEIFQYAGDQVVITWTKKNGLRKANCIRCFFKIKHKLDTLQEDYVKRFGMFPKIKAGLHFGKVIVGEIGDSKKEIVYHGDVINTASRIQEECNTLGSNFLISREVLDIVELPEAYRKELMGRFLLKGKEHEVEIYSVEESTKQYQVA
ncbi:MAG: adenylate/guanylate cyclase domain-containing protein [Ignavibacteriae bacterium]|nr:adenylate/guanylate cyclase domain-containing protein [Ignavibacteriota bacterium]